MPDAILLLFVFCAGVASVFQPLINARLALKIGALSSAAVSFAVGTAALVVAVVFAGKLSGLRGLGGAEWWELSGGVIGAVFVFATILVFPRVGATTAVAAVITAQLATGLVLDQFGAFGFRQIGLDWKRVLGVALLVLGAILVYRR